LEEYLRIIGEHINAMKAAMKIRNYLGSFWEKIGDLIIVTEECSFKTFFIKFLMKIKYPVEL